MLNEIEQIVATTPLADTHEHLREEPDRLPGGKLAQDNDIRIFFSQYVDSDLAVAGMPEADLKLINSPETDLSRKWNLIRPWWERIKNTGYGFMVRESIRALYGEIDIADDNFQKINDGIRNLIKPGYYQRVLKDICNIDHCQVNALETPVYRETTPSALLLQDICTTQISSSFDPAVIRSLIGREVKSVDDCLEGINLVFTRYGTQAIAVKNQSAYQRKLDYKRWSFDEVTTCFKYCIGKNWQVAPEERKPLEDYLFHYSVDKAVEYNLPIKLHTGFYAGRGNMPLHRVRHNAGDISELCQQHPEAKFVLMHIIYPYQDEAIALAKHYANAYIDMCWVWMFNPLAGIRFLKEYLLAAPTNKLLTFGGDVSFVELVPGQVHAARKGICQGISELVAEGWVPAKDVPKLINRIMRGNAYDLFPVQDRLSKK
jgi:hypothetical protein